MLPILIFFHFISLDALTDVYNTGFLKEPSEIGASSVKTNLGLTISDPHPILCQVVIFETKIYPRLFNLVFPPINLYPNFDSFALRY